MLDTLINDALWDMFYECHVGQTAENMADKDKIFDTDGYPRFGTTAESLANLGPAFMGLGFRPSCRFRTAPRSLR